MTIAEINKFQNENLKALAELTAIKKHLVSMQRSSVIDIKLYANSMISRVDTDIAHISKALPKSNLSNRWRNALIGTAILTAITIFLI